MTPKYEESSREDKKLLKALKKNENNDGYYELVMASYDINRENLKFFLCEFEKNVSISNCINELYKEMSLPNFRKKMRSIAQASIRDKVLNGSATYHFIQVVASEADLSWIKEEMSAHPTSKKIKVLYFYKKFEQLFFLDKQPSRSKIKKLLEEYCTSCKKTSDYLLKLCYNESAHTAFECDEIFIMNALKCSF